MSRLDSHIAAVQRKLTLALFLEWLSITALVTSTLALLVILAHKALHIPLPPVALWVALGAMVIIALAVAILRRPDRRAAAIAIDEKLGLKEKFSTALHARPLSADPVASAVLFDAEQTAEKVRLAGHFPLALPRPVLYALAVALAAGLCMRFIPPLDLFGRQKAQQARREEALRIAEARAQIRDTIVKIESAPKVLQENEEVKIAKARLLDLEKQGNIDPTRAARQRVEALSKVEEALKKQVAENKQYAKAQQTINEFRAMNTPVSARDDEITRAHRNLAKGDFQEALKELDKAAEAFKQLPPEKKEEAAKNMQNLAEALKAMAQDPRAQQKLNDQLQQLGANKQQIQQAQNLVQQLAQGNPAAQQQMQQLAQQLAQQMNQGQGANAQQLQQLQQAIAQAQQAAGAQNQAGQMGQAAQQLAQAMQQAAQQGGNANAGQQVQQNMQQLQNALNQLDAMKKDAQQMQQLQQDLQQAMNQAGGQCNGQQGQNQGQGQGQGEWDNNLPQNQGNGQGQAGIGGGGAGEKSETPFQTKGELSRSDYDERGQHLASIYVKDRGVRGESKAKLEKAIDASKAAAGDDVDDSRASRHAQEVQKRYFNALSDEVRKP